MTAIDDAVAATAANLTGALYTALNGAMSVAQLAPIVAQALASTDYANVLAGYVAAAGVAEAAASGAMPSSDLIAAYAGSRAAQNPTTTAALP